MMVQSQPLKTLIPTSSYASQIMKYHHSVVRCALNMEDLTSNNFRKFYKQQINLQRNLVHMSLKLLTDSWATLYHHILHAPKSNAFPNDTPVGSQFRCQRCFR